jgi:hypothetical protein
MIPHRFTVAEYLALGIRAETELIGGLIYDVAPKSPPQTFAIRRLNQLLVAALAKPGDPYEIRAGARIAVAGEFGGHALEIDVAVVRARLPAGIPAEVDAHAFIEVSDATYADDKAVRIPLYLEAGVPTWHVNIPARRVECYDRYAVSAKPRICSELDFVEILGAPVPVAQLFAGADR